MSGNAEDEKDTRNAIPLDLARNQIAAVRTVENKAPLVISQALRSVRVLAQGVSCSTSPSPVGQTIITNIVPQAVIKQDGRAQIAGIISTQAQTQISGNLAIQRPAQITLTTSPIVAQNASGATYHVPRGPAVVANLAAPRSNVTAVRSPMVVTAQNSQSGSHTFVKPPRTPSPAQGTAWLTTNSSSGSQVKGAPTVLSSPVRGATVTGKLQVTGRPSQPQTISTIKSGTILQNSITVGQTGQIHPYKPLATNVQSTSTNVTLAQMLPSRTQAVIYGTNSSTQFTSSARVTVTSSIQNPTRPLQTRPTGQVSSPRLSVPISQMQSHSRLITPSQASPISSNSRVSSLPSTTQHQNILGSGGRIVASGQPSSSLARMSVLPPLGTTTVTAVAATITNSTLLSSQPRTLNIQSLVAVANSGHSRIAAPQGAKIIAQPAQATIHLTSIQPSQITTKANTVITTGARTINVPATIVAQQRPTTADHPEALSIAKVFPTSESQGALAATNVFIHAPIQTQRQTLPTPGSANTAASSQHSSSSLQPTTLAGNTSYFYESTNATAAYSRPIGQQPTAFAAIPQNSAVQQARAINSVNTQQAHGVVSNQNARFSSVVVVDQSRIQQTSQFQSASNPQTAESQAISEILHHQSQQSHNKITSSPRPSILRKRDHDGSPLKAAKNLTPVLQNFGQQPSIQAPLSPRPPRPDSRDNGNSSGGSTTISATSSPGLAEVNEDDDPPIPMNVKEEEVKPPMEMSPRKKPRKQQLAGNEMDGNNDDMQFISENGTVKKEKYDSDEHHSDGEPKDGAPEAVQVSTMRKPASASLLNGYRQTWKATHNHYQRYSDVKPKDERRPTIMDLANQHRVLDKVNGWKIHHLSTQMENLAEEEQSVYNRLTELLKFTEAEESNKQFDKEFNRINELIKGNLQRIKIINDGMLDAKSQIMKIFDHQRHVMELINRCASKRNFKKREKS